MKTKKIEYIDLANVIAAIAVVFLHTNGCFWEFNKSRYWITANLIESVFIFAVPVFFMISSVTLMDYQKRYNTKTFLKKRFSKTVIPFLFWTFVGLVFDIVFLHTLKPSDLTLRVLVDGIIKYLFIIGFIFNGTIPFLLSAMHIDMAWPLGINVVSGYAIFVVMGYLIHKMDFTPNQRCIIYVAGLAGFLMHFGGTYFESYALGGVSQIYKNLMQAPILMYSGAVFLFIKQISSKVMQTKISKSVQFIKKYTFPIYLMHYANYTKSIIYRLGMPLVVIPITIILTAFIRKLRVGKKVLP